MGRLAAPSTDLQPLSALVDHLQLAAALVDDGGWIVATNAPWRATVGAGILAGSSFAEGDRFVDACRRARPDDLRLLAAAASALEALCAGAAPELGISYTSMNGGLDHDGALLEPHTFAMRFMRLEGSWGRVVLVTHRRRTLDLHGPTDAEISTQRAIELEALVVRRTEELLQAQKLEGIGRLAGGVAHDFNNLLTIILTYGQKVVSELDPSTRTRGYVEEMVTAGQRAAELTRQLLSFARKQVVEPRVVDMNEIVLTTDTMLRPLLGEDIELVTLTARERCTVKIDPGQLERILLNLAANARDAMPGGGRLALVTDHVVLESDSRLVGAGLMPGRFVRLVVRDTGTGIPHDVLPNVFEPFFTTKDIGAGTGLGLASAYGIVKQAGGHIHVESGPGKGTAFEIYLPSIEAEPTAAPEEPAPRSAGGDETILIVEDEPMLREITAEILRDEGYTVLAAEGGADAIRLSEDGGQRIDLVLTDMVMPHMSGRAAASRILSHRPKVRFLFMSGYAAASHADEARTADDFAFIAKPFTREALLRRVRELLDEPRG